MVNVFKLNDRLVTRPSDSSMNIVFKVVLLTPVKQICWMQTDVSSRFFVDPFHVDCCTVTHT